jgi:tRNA G18 (ribose-2'-O)-methylase SpoU
MPIMNKSSSGVTGKIFKLSALTRQLRSHTQSFPGRRLRLRSFLGLSRPGLTDNEIAAARMAVSIPMSGEVESLNVSVGSRDCFV